ncbi:MAG: ABC transporter permease [Planctomycetaceae bacterium]|nr:ABC transporter permease [Planctomycetaceae bacterium]
MRTLFRWFVTYILPPLGAFFTVVILWHFATVIFDIKRYILPGPLLVAEAGVKNLGELWNGFLMTGAEAIVGFAASLCVGTLVACLFSQSPVIRRSLFPYAIFLQTVPIVAIAPLIVIWFGTGFQSVVLVSFIISLFPIITNATAGLLQVDPDLLDLFRLNNATRWQTLLKLRLPSAVPSIITGARIASGVAVIGAIVGEFFAGYVSRKGLGYLILQTAPQLKTDKLFATVIASTILGLTIFALVSLIGNLILNRWYDGEA